MPRRQRWKPVSGTRTRIYEPWERFLVGILDAPGRAVSGGLRLLGAAGSAPVEPQSLHQVLVLRLDRIGDVLMSLPALWDLRAALPKARIRLAVGRWSEEVARSAPVDEILVWSVPWVGRADEGSETWSSLWSKAWSLRRDRPDLAIDLQGDVRASALMRATGTRVRVGYANTGGAYLLTHVVPLDESVSWVEQNRRAVALLFGTGPAPPRFDALTPTDRDFARRLFESLGLESKRPLVGIHPSGGRRIKEWVPGRWAAVASRLQEEFRATILITGSEADRPLAAVVGRDLRDRALDLTGRLTVRETMAVIARLDLFLSPDTGPMHMACAVDTPSVSVFGPSDPTRYFSGGSHGLESRHVVVRHDLWCSPCNLIRRPPEECVGPEPPECLAGVGVEAVLKEASRLLRSRMH